MTPDNNAVEALRAADAAWLKAYVSKDVEKSASFFDEHGAMLIPNLPPVIGKDAIAAFIKKSFAMRDYNIRWHPDNAGVAQSGELGYTSGAYEMSFQDPSGKIISDKGKYLMVWKKGADGDWRVLFDTSSSDLPRLPGI